MKIGRTELAILVLVWPGHCGHRAGAEWAVLMPMVNHEILVAPPQPIDPVDRRRILPPQSMLPFRVTSSQVHVRIEENVSDGTILSEHVRPEPGSPRDDPAAQRRGDQQFVAVDERDDG